MDRGAGEMNKWVRRILLAVMVSGISVVSFFYSWPHIAEWWGDVAYVQLLPCDGPDSPMVPGSAAGKSCYATEDIFNIEKALRISDAIALLAVLVAIVTLTLPIFAFLSIKLERKSIDEYINTRFNELGKKQHELVSEELSRLNAYRTLLSLANLVADAFSIGLNDKSDLDNLRTVGDVREKIRQMIDHSAAADQLRSTLTNLLEENDENFAEGVGVLSSFVDIDSPEAFTGALEEYLREIRKAGYVDTPEKKEKLGKFLEEKSLSG